MTAKIGLLCGHYCDREKPCETFVYSSGDVSKLIIGMDVTFYCPGDGEKRKASIESIIIEGDHHKNGTAKESVTQIEPAPPKDWVPVCYNYSELNGGCEQIPFISSPECDQCPYKDLKPSNEE